MDYFISMFLRSDVRFSASFLEKEEKSSLHTNSFHSMILLKIICGTLGGYVLPEILLDLDCAKNLSLNQRLQIFNTGH